MMNSLQSVVYWQDYFDNPDGAPLGLLNAIFSVGSMVAMPIFPFIADRFGRRWELSPAPSSRIISQGVV
jgi:MFS family permease